MADVDIQGEIGKLAINDVVAAAGSYPVREFLLIIFNDEWEHRLCAERDLDALAERSRR